jgi:hypothetical protein
VTHNCPVGWDDIPPPQFAVFTVVREEQPYIEEFVMYHLFIQAVGQLFESNLVHEGVLLGTLHHPRVPLVPHGPNYGLRSHASRSHGVEERGGGGRVIRCSRRRVCALTESYAMQNL